MIKRTLIRLKFRFDLGASFLSIINFSFVVIAASSNIKTLFPSLETRYLLLITVPGAILSVVILGFVLDKLRVAQMYNDEANNRNENWEKLFKILEKK